MARKSNIEAGRASAASDAGEVGSRLSTRRFLSPRLVCDAKHAGNAPQRHDVASWMKDTTLLVAAFHPQTTSHAQTTQQTSIPSQGTT